MLSLPTATKQRTASPGRSPLAQIVSVTCLLLLLSAGWFSSPNEQARAASGEQAISADSFVDSIGVVTHLGYNNTPYNNYALIKQKLQEAGIRHIRDAGNLDKVNDLATVGIHTNLGIDLSGQNINLNVPPAGTTPGTVYAGCLHTDRPCYYVKDYLSQVKSAVDQVEGLNEYDLFNGSYPVTAAFQPYPQSPYGNTTWYRVLCDYMQQLHDTLRSDPAWSTLPIVGPSFGENAGPTYVKNTCGDWAGNWVDYANLHDYVGAPMAPAIQNNVDLLKGTFLNTSLQTTETGWNTTKNAASPISETVQGKYIPRLLFEQINHGISRTYTYELIDEFNDPNNPEANYGLLRNDFSEKPAFVAEKNMTALLADPGDPIAPGMLDYTLNTNNNASVHHTLLQKRDGTFYLALWQDVASTDTDVTAPVTVTFNTPVSEADVYSPNDSTTAVATNSNPTSLNLNVPDKVMLVKITPSTLVPPAAGTPPPPPTPCPNYVCPQPPLPPPPPAPGALPDVVVTNIQIVGNPVQGQPLRETATVRNVGAGPTPDGIITGVAFYGPGGMLNFEDTYNQSIPPGGTIELTSNANALWTPKAGGRISITAVVDDVNRIAESNDNNNAFTKHFTIETTGSVPVGLTATAGNSTVYLDWAGTTNATSYNIKRTEAVSGGTPPPQPPLVAGRVDPAPSTIDLTAEGVADWAHWGYNSNPGFDHKANVTSMISNFSLVNYGYTANFNNSNPSFSWSDGTPDASATTGSGVYIGPYVQNSGFTFSVPADTYPRMLKVYANYDTSVVFRASLTDGSAPDYTFTATQGGTGVFTIIFSAGSSGQTLNVSLVAPNYQHINLYAATLSNPIALGPLQTIASNVQGQWYQDTNVTPGSTYFYSVSAVTSAGEGANSNLAAAAADPGTATISPILECVANQGGGVYTAYFGYKNSGTDPVEIPAGKVRGTANYFHPDPADRGQPTVFQPGRSPLYPHPAFSVNFDGSNLVWNVNGNTATASYHSTPCPTATLFGGETAPTSTVDLTAEGTTDWVHWGYTSGTSFDHKANVTSMISNYSVVGAGYINNFGGAQVTYNWSDGTPDGSASTNSGIYIGPYIDNSGFTFTVPADTTTRTLKVYVGVYQSQMQFKASLSDGIAADLVDTSFINMIGSSTAVYTLTFKASAPGQTLTITMIKLGNTGNINLQAATLS